MKKYNDQFDDFIREALKGHRLTPREKARKAFLEEASAIIPTRRGWKPWFYIPLIIAFVAGFVAFFVYDPVNKQAAVPVIEMPGTSPDENNLNEEVVSPSLSQPTAIQDSGTDTVAIFEKHISQPDKIITIQSANKKESVPNRINSDNISIEPVAGSVDPIAANNEQTIENQTPLEVIQDSIQPAGTVKILDNPDAGTDLNKPEPGDVEQTEPVENPKVDLQWKFAAGAYYLPEYMFNTLEGGKFVNNFGLEAIFYRGPVSIRTGAGISVSKGITTNSVDYNDYLGTYNKLDSITFSYNEQLNNFEPVIYTSNEKVWDSIPKSDSADIVKRYTYLQVPLVLGFDFWQKGGFSLGVRVGTIASVMLKSKQLTGDYDPGENQVVGVSTLTPSQVSLNWQAMGGISASAVLTRRISIEVEPGARYYYGSIYEDADNVKKPWSLVIRTAIIYKF